MPISRSSKRILVVGREVGPVVQLIKEKKPKVSIGAVDILGNQETRLYADWKFSIEKQSPDTLIQRSKHRSIVDLLLELTLVMLEDIEFDLLIPLAPLQTKPKVIEKLSREIEIFGPSYRLLEQASSAYVFLTKISSNHPELIPSSVFSSDLSKAINFPAICVSQCKGLFIIPSERSIASLDLSNLSGFLFPISQIHCAFFLKMSHEVKFLGLQTLSAPHEHAFFPNNLEKNGMTPLSIPGFTYERIISYLSLLINKLGIVGMGTIYFGLSENKILPVSCNILPDENLAFWEKKSSRSIVPFLLNENSTHTPQFNSVSAFKTPIYSYHSIRVPTLSEGLCTQRNLPGVISHPEYPLCAISAASSSSSSANEVLKQKKIEILNVLHP